MSIAENVQLREYCQDVAVRAKEASAKLATVSGDQKNSWLRHSANRLREQVAELLKANARDLDAAPEFGLTEAQIDRLKLSQERIDGIAAALEEIAMFTDPIGEVIESTVRPSGLEVSKIRVPMGVVFFVYESRPNVTADAAAICIKSGNAVILRGGKEAAHSSRAIVDVMMESAEDFGIPQDAVQLVATTDRDAVGHFLSLNELIDVAIPRGGEGLIRRVTEQATMPVIKHFNGNCHVFVDAAADLAMAVDLVVNSKCQRLGVCNACESLLVHADIASEFLPMVSSALSQHGVEMRGDEKTCDLVPDAIAATDKDFATEYLDSIISIKVVESAEEAIEHINRYGSHHTDAIVTTDVRTARAFTRSVDSAAVMVNASTRFNDGGEFGLGAEIGISTDKFHARGPCGPRELTTYKFVCYGDGHLRT